MSESFSSPSLRDLLAMSDRELGQQDIAAVSLACAVGLPGSEALDIPFCLRRLDEWTERVRCGIGHAMANRKRFPEFDELCESEYKILTMFSVLYRHIGLTVNVAFNEDPYNGSDSRTHFIHAVLMDGFPATCCTAPVIFAAIGRRLGFPIKLVKTTRHIFCRWEGAGERFNIEATDRGYYRNPDEHYHSWPKPINMDRLRQGVLMRNLSPREEFGLLLGERALCFAENLRIGEALKAGYYACKLDPRDPLLRNGWMIDTLIYRAVKESAAGDAFAFVPSDLRIPTPRAAWERSIYQAACHSLNRVLENRRRKLAANTRDVALQEEVTSN